MIELTLKEVSQKLTREVIDQAFKLATNSNDQVKNIEVGRAAPAGEGLISAVYRLKVSGNQHSTSFIVKGLLKDQLLRKSIECANFFQREIHFFSKVLPLLIQVQKSLGGKERIQNNIPLCYSYYCNGSDDFILLEDLGRSGVTSVQENPTEYERNAVLKVLAHFHATSMALREHKPSQFEKMKKEHPEIYYTEARRSWYTPFQQSSIDIDKVALAEFEDNNNVYYQKFLRLVDNDAYGQMVEIAKQCGDNCVLNHGDVWGSNFLLTKERTVAIDFQLTRCVSPAVDLSYFTLLCSNLHSTAQDFLKAIKVYHDYLRHYLSDMGIEIDQVFPWDTLVSEMQKYGKFGLLAAMTTIPLQASARCDVLESFEEKFKGVARIPLEELWKLTPLENQKHKNLIVNAVRVAVDFGLI